MLISYELNANESNTVPFNLDTPSNVLSFGINDNTLSFDLNLLQKDVDVVITIGQNVNGQLLENGLYTVAELVIPAKKYIFVDTHELDESDNPIIEQHVLPLDVENIKLTLWQLSFALEEQTSDDIFNKQHGLN